MVAHDGTNGYDDGFSGPDAGTGEVRRMEVFEPGGHFVRRGVGEEEANLALYALPITVTI